MDVANEPGLPDTVGLRRVKARGFQRVGIHSKEWGTLYHIEGLTRSDGWEAYECEATCAYCGERYLFRTTQHPGAPFIADTPHGCPAHRAWRERLPAITVPTWERNA